ncbi:La [Sphaceloma murrayae]|uniref:La n=1 Tax=Sphaceloma murrayae TaxID=2082308 RepID=A0A2K1QUU3_9PEZI|nr:La [Sphaceloma murrayae]
MRAPVTDQVDSVGLTELEKEIIRQVEHYFSDENLPNDAHMLALTGGSENWPVNIGRITGFGRMRGYKPKSIVAEAIKKSTFLEFTDKKHIRRREPLAIKPNVEPEIIPGKNAPALAKARKTRQPRSTSGTPSNPASNQPWLTKGMLKETGFEEYFADAPLTPAQYLENQSLYSPDNIFSARIEAAIQRYASRRKFHADTRQIFDLWMTYGGIDARPRQFTGGLSKDDMESMDAGEIASALATHFVASHVEHSEKWTVDFAGVARGFLCADTILQSTGGHPDNVGNFTNVMTNFYRYLLHHDVCPEYNDQIKDAMKICRIADRELANAVSLCSWLPDGYNRACSAVSGGASKAMLRQDNEDTAWWAGGEAMGVNKSDAEMIVVSAIALMGDNLQRNLIVQERPKDVFKTSEQELALQVAAIEMPDESLQARFHEEKQANKAFEPLGKMHCRRMNEKMTGLSKKDERTYTFWIKVGILEYAFVGMKLQGTVCENNLGCLWLDRIQGLNASYYEVVPNGFYKREQDAVIPREWYKRQRRIKEYGYKALSEMGREMEAEEGAQPEQEDDAIDQVEPADEPSCTFVDHRDVPEEKTSGHGTVDDFGELSPVTKNVDGKT